jgi:3-hydroxyisobutyrate dehydrogenase-like beta-hydroxyacid dehydrogenase
MIQGAVSFLGLGNMGLPMARNLAARARQSPLAPLPPLRVWNRSPGRALPLVEAGALAFATPRECVQGAAFVVTMLADRAALEATLSGPDGALAGLEPGAIVIEMSTSGRAAVLAAEELVRSKGARLVDAPVSGSVIPAERGELVALVGAEEEDLRAAEPVLAAMCKRILHAGGVGQGQALKVILNGLGAHHLVAFTSMLVLGERAGLDRETIVEAFTSGAFASPSYIGKKKKVLAQNFAPEFSLELTEKDVALNAELQDEVGLRLPVVDAIHAEVKRAVESGLGPEDLFAMEKYYAGRHG